MIGSYFYFNKELTMRFLECPFIIGRLDVGLRVVDAFVCQLLQVFSVNDSIINRPELLEFQNVLNQCIQNT